MREAVRRLAGVGLLLLASACQHARGTATPETPAESKPTAQQPSTVQQPDTSQPATTRRTTTAQQPPASQQPATAPQPATAQPPRAAQPAPTVQQAPAAQHAPTAPQSPTAHQAPASAGSPVKQPVPIAPGAAATPPPLEAPDATAPASAELGRAEDAVYRQVAGAFARAGRPVPERDAALDAAARDLARSAPPEGPGRARVAEALSRRGASDPSPRVFELRTTALDALAPALEGRADVTADPTTHVGVGAVDVGGEVVLIALLSQRKAVLDPFPRAFADAGATGTLCGALVPPLADPALYLTRPDGQVDQQRADAKHGARFCMRVRLPVRGRYVLQVLGTSRTGAEVAALFSVDVGAAPPSLDACCGEEPATLSAAREVLLARINTLRAAHRAGVLLPDRRLDGVAQAYAERMAREGFFAHVAPDGSRLRDRVSAAGLRPRVTGENLARADTSLAAQASLEASPGHRRNLLERQFTHAGLGVAFRTLPGGERQAVLVQVFAALPLPNAH